MISLTLSAGSFERHLLFNSHTMKFNAMTIVGIR